MNLYNISFHITLYINYNTCYIIYIYIYILFHIYRISPFGVARDVVKADGFKGLYRGLTGIWTKEVPGSFIYFGSYEAAKHFIRGTTEVQLVATKLGLK